MFTFINKNVYFYKTKAIKRWLKTFKMNTINLENGFLNYTVDQTEITIDNIKVYEQKKGTGKKLIEEVKKIARENNLPIGLYAEPQDETINENELKDFYYACGFILDTDDTDNKLFIWK